MSQPKQDLPVEIGSLPVENAEPENEVSLDQADKASASSKFEDAHSFAWSVFNRDLSQLEFFKRVLEEAADESVPPLERLKFLAVFASNLDEFFMVRVSGLKEMLEIEEFQPMPGELAPAEQLKMIRERVLPMVEEQVNCLRNGVLPALAKHGVEIVRYDSLTTLEKKVPDLGLLTANTEIGDDATDLFNYMTGFSRPREYTHLMVAPVNLRERMLALIEREIGHARAGRPARIAAKINRLTDLEIIDALYRASQSGVKIDLVVRGSCMLRPRVSGLSETVHVRSIVGQFLEHSRIFYFANGGDDDVYIGSADWMTRNLDRRVEVVTPVLDVNLKRHLKEVVLAAYLKDNVKARVLNADGNYERVPMSRGEASFNSQLHFEGSISLSA